MEGKREHVCAFIVLHTSHLQVAILAVCAAVMTCIVKGFLNTLYSPLGLPQLTMAFSFTACVFILIQGSLVAVYPVPLDQITTPEDHLKKTRLIRGVLRKVGQRG